MRTCICPGSFDPLTNGHLDVIERATKLFDRVIVAVARNESKDPLFTLEERVDLARCVLRDLAPVEVDSFECLLVDYAEQVGAQAVVRGLRAGSGSDGGINSGPGRRVCGERNIGPRKLSESRKHQFHRTLLFVQKSALYR